MAKPPRGPIIWTEPERVPASFGVAFVLACVLLVVLALGVFD